MSLHTQERFLSFVLPSRSNIAPEEYVFSVDFEGARCTAVQARYTLFAFEKFAFPQCFYVFQPSPTTANEPRKEAYDEGGGQVGYVDVYVQ